MALLGAVGATVTAFGKQMYEVSSDNLKAMNTVQIMEHLGKIAKGLRQDVTDLEGVHFVLVKTMLRHALPHSGIVFLEGLSIKSMEDLRRGLESWLSTRAAGDYTRIPGQAAKLPEKSICIPSK